MRQMSKIYFQFFGSINIDQVIRVPSIARPGETTLGERVMVAFGGKGANQAVAAARTMSAEGSVCMIGAVGQDAHGRAAIKNLDDNGIACAVAELADSTTGTAIITVSQGGENAITVVPGANKRLALGTEAATALARTDTLLCQGEVSFGATRRAIETFRTERPQGRVIVNLAPVPQSLGFGTLRSVLAHTDTLIVNSQEADDVVSVLGEAESLATSDVAREFKLLMIITLGSASAMIHAPDGTSRRITTPAIDPAETTGAGDTFCGVLAALVTEGWDVDELHPLFS